MSKLFSMVCIALVAGCVSRSEIEEIQKSQKDILTKLDQIAKSRGPMAQQPPRQAGPDPAKAYAVPADGAAKGAEDAWVTIVEISDFQCPFCKRVGDTLKEVEQKYGKDVRVVFKHNPLPFHNRAKPAALAAECANEQGKFWQMHDELFGNQQALEDAALEANAQKIGLNMGKWKECVSSGKYNAKLDADQQMANQFGARGTPAFFINGRFLSGAQPFDNFKSIIDEELQKAKASGMKGREYYQKNVLEKGAKAL
jgi:protein-disulfide isomerase